MKLTTPDGVTTYEYDPLDRLIKTTTPDGKSEHITYNGEGDVTLVSLVTRPRPSYS